MSPSAHEPAHDQQPAPAQRSTADPERQEAARPAHPGQARLQHLFRHAGDGPDSRFLQDLVIHHRKRPAT